MYLQSKSAKPFEVDKTFNKCFIEQWNKGRWHKSSYCYCASGWRMYVLRTDHHSTGCIKCQRSFTVLIPRYGDSKPTCAYLEAHAKWIFKPTGNHRFLQRAQFIGQIYCVYSSVICMYFSEECNNMNICNMKQYAANVYCEMLHRVLHYLTNVKYKDGRYFQFFRSVSNTQAITAIKELCVNKSL